MSNELVFNANYFYAKIDYTMLDIASATHPAVFMGELYIKMLLHCSDYINLLLGSSYRFSHNNAAIEYIIFGVIFNFDFRFCMREGFEMKKKIFILYINYQIDSIVWCRRFWTRGSA